MNPYIEEGKVQDSYTMHSKGAMLYFFLLLLKLYIFLSDKWGLEKKKKAPWCVAYSRNSPGLLPKMWPQCSWNTYIFFQTIELPLY